MSSLRTLIVDDEPLARSRLRTLLAECHAPAADVIGEAAQATEAEQRLDETPADLVLLDIHMPGVDGTEFARVLRGRADAPAIVFVTAHSGHAVTAFELDAVDYLTKPVRAERLQQALQKAERYLKEKRAALPDPNEEVFLIQDRGRAERVPVAEVVYLKSEFKYLTVRTPSRSHIYDASLAEIEERYPDRFVRVHRNALVARSAMRALEKYDDGEDIDGWALRLRGIAEPVVVSRRQLAVVRDALKDLR
ncbi:LytTR family DNA-binding domain-containing protein [Variovorax sp. dw_954]|uniref:LytR/AlgR family response regulator transcription factor n=1 Tax=Variovorax sp. dw_954 TaxID=2720078 RepID=UPI001BD4F039|nr:LytTR family DNA-binding domain-containing protein [Variovorax sp. dw_954]